MELLRYSIKSESSTITYNILTIYTTKGKYISNESLASPNSVQLNISYFICMSAIDCCSKFLYSIYSES